MSIPITVWLVITGILGIIATLAIWSRGITRARAWSVAAFLLASPAAAASLGFSLGWAVPLVQGVTLSAGEHTILGAKMIVGEGIFLLMDRGMDAPRYVYIPWNEETAKKLQDALEEKGEEGTAGMKVKPFEWSWDQGPPLFYADPQPKMLPDKIEPAPPPTYESEV